MPKSRKRTTSKSRAASGTERRTTAATPSTILALNGIDNHYVDGTAAPELRAFADMVEAGGRPVAKGAHDDDPEFEPYEGIEFELADGRSMWDATIPTRSDGEIDDIDLIAAAGRWRLIADQSINPGQGFRELMSPGAVSAVVKGFAEIEKAAEAARDYLRATITSSGSDDERPLDLLIRFGSPGIPPECSIWTSNDCGYKVEGDADRSAAEAEIVRGILKKAPHAYRLENEHDGINRVSRLEMRYEKILGYDPVEAMRTIRAQKGLDHSTLRDVEMPADLDTSLASSGVVSAIAKMMNAIGAY